MLQSPCACPHIQVHTHARAHTHTDFESEKMKKNPYHNIKFQKLSLVKI